MMEPIAISVRGDGEWVVVHRCSGCETVRLNRTAGDDNPLLLLRLAVRPLSQPRFPIAVWGGVCGAGARPGAPALHPCDRLADVE